MGICYDAVREYEVAIAIIAAAVIAQRMVLGRRSSRAEWVCLPYWEVAVGGLDFRVDLL